MTVDNNAFIQMNVNLILTNIYILNHHFHDKIILYRYKRIYLKSYHRIKADAQVNPLPNAAKQTILSSVISPSCQASLRAIGIDAAVVLP